MKFLLAALLATVAFGDAHLHGTCHIVADGDGVTDNDTTNGDMEDCCGVAGDAANTCEGDTPTKTFTARCPADHTGLMGGTDALCCEPETANAQCWSAEGTCTLAGDDAPKDCAAAAAKMTAAFAKLQTDMLACKAKEDAAAADRRRLEAEGEDERDVSCYVSAMTAGEAACDAWIGTFDGVTDARIKEVTTAQIGKTAADHWYADGECAGMAANMNRNGWLTAYGFDDHDLKHLTDALKAARTPAADGSADDGSAASSAAVLSAAAALVAFAL